MKRIYVHDDMNTELKRIQKEIERKEQHNIPMIDTTERIAKVLKKIKI